MSEELKFVLKLNDLFEQGRDLADAVGEMIEESSNLHYTWVGEDDYGMASFYDDSPAIYQVDYSKSSFNSGRIYLVEKTENIDKLILAEFIAAGCLIPKNDILAAAGSKKEEARDRSLILAETYFNNIPDEDKVTLTRVAEKFDLQF
jgi:hypothetical protein